jgi:FtsH-binding integral membrane protein
MANSSIYNRLIGGLKKTGGAKTNLSELFKIINEKKIFFILIFVNLFVQLGITYYTMENSSHPKEKTTFWLLIIASFILLMGLSLIPMPSFFKVLVFVAFSYVWGLLLTSIKTKHNENQIRIAIQGALSVFAAMLAVGLGLLITGIQLGYQFGLFLFCALLLLIIARLVTLFSGTLSTMRLGLSIFGIILFALYVMYDTNVIFRRDYGGDFITASMDYYLDILNLFTNLLKAENS